jgi:tetratricopeptide (TPR) repeat protein
MKFLWIAAVAVGLNASISCCEFASRSMAGEVRAGTPAEVLDRRIAKLIERLGDTQFVVRQRAQEELIALGFEAFDALSEAEKNDDPEIAMQAAYLVRLIRVDWTREGDPRQIQQILKDYEAQSDERRLLRIKQLGELPGDLGLEWLCKLVRFERSPVLSKQAALAIMSQDATLDEAAWARRGKTVEKLLERGRRPAVKWILTDLQAHHDPAGALQAWTAIAEAERQTLEQHPQETHNQIAMNLLRRKIDLLDRLHRDDEVADTMRQIVLCERGDSASLVELVDWLVKRKAWNVVDEVATRFAASFEIDALLTYTLCEARLAQGNRELAEQAADRALKLNGDKSMDHVTVARRLLDRGLIEWSDREFRYVISLGPITAITAITARRELSESLHDRLLDLEAAEVIKELIDVADRDVNVQQQIRTLLQQSDNNPNMLRARMYFLYACHAGSQNDVAKQRDFLDKALEQDSSDVDVLIASYRLSDKNPEHRAKIVDFIKEAVDDCRAAIEDSPDDDKFYNQLAWLVANTEGDIDEAIRCSHKSVELTRAAAVAAGDFKRIGGLLDTLGHCYYAKKDYENAVKYQTEATKLDPHSQVIRRQLNVFRQALVEQQRDAAK